MLYMYMTLCCRVCTVCNIVSMCQFCVLYIIILQYGWRVVHFAAFYGHKAVLEKLLDRYPHLKDKRVKVITVLSPLNSL